MQPIGKRRQRIVARAGADQRDPECQTFVREAGWHGDGGEAEEIGEVRVMPEPAVEADRVGLHGVDGVGGRRGGQQQGVAGGPRRLGAATQRLERITPLEGIDSAKAMRAFDDGANRRVEVRGVIGREGLDRGETFRDPRPVVEEDRRLAERRVVELDRCGAETVQPCDGLVVKSCGVSIAVELTVLRPQHADPRSGRQGHGCTDT